MMTNPAQNNLINADKISSQYQQKDGQNKKLN